MNVCNASCGLFKVNFSNLHFQIFSNNLKQNNQKPTGFKKGFIISETTSVNAWSVGKTVLEETRLKIIPLIPGVKFVKSKFKKSQLIISCLKQANDLATQNHWSKALERVQGHLSSILSRVQSILTVSISSFPPLHEGRRCQQLARAV